MWENSHHFLNFQKHCNCPNNPHLPPLSPCWIRSRYPPMGCSASRAVPNGSDGEKGMGLFRHRIDEMKKKKRAKSGSTLSSKELLTNEGGISNACSKRLPESYDDLDKEESQMNDPALHDKKISDATEEKNVVSAVESDDKNLSGSSDEKMAVSAGESNENKVSGSLDDKTAVSAGESDEKKVSGSLDEKKVNSAGELVEKKASGSGASKEEEEEVVVVELGFGDVPSSPSFREYFKSAGNLENGDSGKVNGGKEGKDCGTVRKRKDSTDSIEEAEGKTTKRGGGKIRVLGKGRGAAYKSFSIRSCYNASPTDSPRLYNAKAN